jgi:hypothetical protein
MARKAGYAALTAPPDYDRTFQTIAKMIVAGTVRKIIQTPTTLCSQTITQIPMMIHQAAMAQHARMNK